MKLDKELKAKGYTYNKTFESKDEAAKYAQEYRELGYYARVVEYSTNVIGLHDFGVWVKRKEV